MILKDLIANTITYDNVEEYINEQINQENLKELFYAIFSVLTRIEVRILEMYYGLNGYERHTIKAISESDFFWHTPCTISKYKQNALKVLQQPKILKLLKQIYQGENINIEKELENIVIHFHSERLNRLWNRKLAQKAFYLKKIERWKNNGYKQFS